jgi:hypothetical protein
MEHSEKFFLLNYFKNYLKQQNEVYALRKYLFISLYLKIYNISQLKIANLIDMLYRTNFKS